MRSNKKKKKEKKKDECFERQQKYMYRQLNKNIEYV